MIAEVRQSAMTASDITVGTCQMSAMQHLHADQDEDRRQARSEVGEALDQPGQQEVQRHEAEQRERVGGEDDERVAVIAKIAGIESIANTTSDVATTTSAANSGVASRLPSTPVTMLSPS